MFLYTSKAYPGAKHGHQKGMIRENTNYIQFTETSEAELYNAGEILSEADLALSSLTLADFVTCLAFMLLCTAFRFPSSA